MLLFSQLTFLRIHIMYVPNSGLIPFWQQQMHFYVKLCRCQRKYPIFFFKNFQPPICDAQGQNLLKKRRKRQTVELDETQGLLYDTRREDLKVKVSRRKKNQLFVYIFGLLFFLKIWICNNFLFIFFFSGLSWSVCQWGKWSWWSIHRWRHSPRSGKFKIQISRQIVEYPF